MARPVELGTRGRPAKPTSTGDFAEEYYLGDSEKGGRELGGGLLGFFRWLGLLLLKQPRAVAWVLPGIWMGLIWFVSGLEDPLGEDPGLSLSYVANLAHAFEYGILTLLLIPTAVRDSGWVKFEPLVLRWQTAMALGYAMVDELHQLFVPGRHSSPLDWLTDVTGVFCTLKVGAYLSDPEATRAGFVGRVLYGCLLCALAASFTFFAV